jgi:hypothetical protein
MRIIFRLTGVVILVMLCAAVKAQSFEVPEFDTQSPDDYARYEKDIIACANWLEETPLDQEPVKRRAANAFLIKWLSGTKDVTVSINSEITRYSDKNPQLLVLFMTGWCRYALQNDHSKDQLRGCYEGIKSMIVVYKKGVGVKKDRLMENLVKVFDHGDLEKWIKENIKFG